MSAQGRPERGDPMTLHVETSGEGPPLVMLHGFALHGGVFATVVPALARRYRVHVVDLPGHGHSIAPAGGLDAYAQAVATVIDSIGGSASLVGWSFGGQVALRLAQLRPKQVHSLVLACTTPKFVASESWPHAMAQQTLARFGDELAVSYRLTLQRFLTLQVQGSEAGRRSLHALREALFARGAPSKETLSGALRILMQTDLRDDVAAISTPTLVIAGQRDALTPAAAGAWLAAAMPQARYREIAGAAHAPFLSHADAFAAAIDQFLDVDAATLSRA